MSIVSYSAKRPVATDRGHARGRAARQRVVRQAAGVAAARTCRCPSSPSARSTRARRRRKSRASSRSRSRRRSRRRRASWSCARSAATAKPRRPRTSRGAPTCRPRCSTCASGSTMPREPAAGARRPADAAHERSRVNVPSRCSRSRGQGRSALAGPRGARTCMRGGSSRSRAWRASPSSARRGRDPHRGRSPKRCGRSASRPMTSRQPSSAANAERRRRHDPPRTVPVLRARAHGVPVARRDRADARSARRGAASSLRDLATVDARRPPIRRR